MNTQKLTSVQGFALVLLRVLIGWHFLYEGVVKAYNPSWTAKGYLLSASILKPFFTWLASDGLIGTVNVLNTAGLMAVGISLLLGLKVRWACLAGMLLLAFYYLAHPPFPGLPPGPAEGSYWVVNKNLIELAALLVIYLFPTGHLFGVERLFIKNKPTPA